MKIRTRLMLSFGTIFIVLAFLGLTSFNLFRIIMSDITNIYEHPFQVSQRVREFREGVHVIHKTMKDIVLLNKQSTEVEKLVVRVEVEKQSQLNNITVINKLYQGDKQDVIKLKDAFLAWDLIRAKVLTAVKKNNNRLLS